MKRKFQVPLVTTFHGFDATMDHPPGGRPRVTWWMYRHKKEELIKEGDLFIAVSSSIREKLLAQGFPEEKTIVHHIGVDPDRLPVNRSLSRETLSRLVTVGRMVEKKGFLDLISAFSLMSNELPSISLDIIGDGALRPRIEAKIKSLGLQQRIRLHGALPYQETHRLVSEADLFCLPSKVASNGDTEGLPISILEAMSMGVPVVSTRHSGIPDAVLEGKTGLMVNEGDIQGLTTACLRILTDAELWLKFSRNSRIRIEERFDIRLQTARLESEYERLTR
jgi:glycosyltransferase involved in cell wall biosynthesis